MIFKLMMDFLVDVKNFIINDSKLRGKFLTNEGYEFITSDDQEVSVFAGQF